MARAFMVPKEVAYTFRAPPLMVTPVGAVVRSKKMLARAGQARAARIRMTRAARTDACFPSHTAPRRRASGRNVSEAHSIRSFLIITAIHGLPLRAGRGNAFELVDCHREGDRRRGRTGQTGAVGGGHGD